MAWRRDRSSCSTARFGPPAAPRRPPSRHRRDGEVGVVAERLAGRVAVEAGHQRDGGATARAVGVQSQGEEVVARAVGPRIPVAHEQFVVENAAGLSRLGGVLASPGPPPDPRRRERPPAPPRHAWRPATGESPHIEGEVGYLSGRSRARPPSARSGRHPNDRREIDRTCHPVTSAGRWRLRPGRQAARRGLVGQIEQPDGNGGIYCRHNPPNADRRRRCVHRAKPADRSAGRGSPGFGRLSGPRRWRRTSGPERERQRSRRFRRRGQGTWSTPKVYLKMVAGLPAAKSMASPSALGKRRVMPFQAVARVAMPDADAGREGEDQGRFGRR